MSAHVILMFAHVRALAHTRESRARPTPVITSFSAVMKRLRRISPSVATSTPVRSRRAIALFTA
jgi:hypothetical protein